MTDSSSSSFDTATLDRLTGGAFSAATSGERTARLREWLQQQPEFEVVQAVAHEMSHRDRGAAKVVRERMEELRRVKEQDTLIQQWAEKGQGLRDAPRINMADAMAWQRDAAKAGAPLSREPLASLKAALAERVKAIEDLQHQAQVEREAAVLLAQRVEVLSTKDWQDAQAQRDAVHADLTRWQARWQALSANAQWPSVDPKFSPVLHASAQQLQAVWEAFEAALSATLAAAADPQAPLPAVPAWADQIRQQRSGGAPAQAAQSPADAPAAAKPTPARIDATRTLKPTADKALVDAKRTALCEQAEAMFKIVPAAPSDAASAAAPALAPAPADASSPDEASAVQAPVPAEEAPAAQSSPAPEAPVAATTPDAAVMPGPAATPDAPVAPATPEAPAVAEATWVPVLTGRKLQERLRQLRDEWKKIDKEAAPSPALWRRFDSACNRAHAIVDAWLKEVRAQSNAVKAQRQALIDEVKAWTQAVGQGPDWKRVVRELHQFSQRWRESGHLSEKAFTEMQALWKQAIHDAHAPLEAVQKASLARRKALIDEAQVLAAEPRLRIDAVKALQQRWQEEAHTVPLERRQEQKLWDAFRQPIDQAFARKTQVRETAQAALSPVDQAVLAAAKALEAAVASGDAARIRAAMAEVEAAARGQVRAPSAPSAPSEAAQTPAAHADAAEAADATEAAPPAPSVPQPKPAVVRPVVAVRGDDRPGQKRTEVAPAARGRDGKPARPGERDRREAAREGGRDRFDHDRRGPAREARPPRLADPAFKAQRHAMELAQTALRKLAAQAHGEVLTQLMQAWSQRDAAQVPTAQALGGRVGAPQRGQWVQALQSAPSAQSDSTAATALLRLEMAAELPTPAAQLDARRALQLQLLTRRNDPAPAQTWASDAAQVLASAHDEAQARRLQAALKVLLKR